MKGKEKRELFLFSNNGPEHHFDVDNTNLRFCELVRILKFKCEKHQVTTNDGYQLKIFRI